MRVLRSRIVGSEDSPKSGVEIASRTPAKEAEPTNKSSYEYTPSSGSVGLRRSARLSLNNDIVVDSEAGSTSTSAATSRGKRKVANFDISEEENALGKELDSVRVTMDFSSFDAIVPKQSVRKVKSQRVDVEEAVDACSRLRSGKKLINNNNMSVKKNEEEEVNMGVDGEEMSMKRYIDEKGKGKVIEASSSSAASHLSGPDAVRMEEPNNNTKERFKNVARENASRFAHFTLQDEDEDQSVLQNEADVEEDWPGPISTAFKIIRDRASSAEEHNKKKKKKKEKTPLIWVPKKHSRLFKLSQPPSLEDLCIKIMSENVDAITSLESVPDAIRHKLTQALCDSRRMNHHFFNLLASSSPPYEIRIKDCSWLNEDQFIKTFQEIDATNLSVLQLDQCGRCLPDYVLYSSLSDLPSKLCALTNISLKGACRLSDGGLNTLISCASALTSINLGCCSLLTCDAIINLADKLGSVLKELYIDECFGMDDANTLLPALFKLQHLEVLSISRFETVNDAFITQFVAVQGHKMKELVLADCMKLTDKALKAIGKNCPGLCAIDLSNLCKLSDASLAHLASGCQTIQTMKLCRNTFSDEAVAAYVEACGGPLTELSLNHVDKVGHETALSVAKHGANKLQYLDLSWCREMSDEAVGLIVDSCLSLKRLKLFGCTQITNVFTEGYSNEMVKIIGLQNTQILNNITAVPHLLP